MRLWAVCLLAACYSPSAKPGAPCSAMGDCPSGLVCAANNTCEPPGTSVIGDAPVDTRTIDGPPDAFVEQCTPEICGNGIDEDCDGIDNPCPANDAAAGAIDVTAGGDFTADVTYATSDSSTGGTTACGTNGGRDVFYSINASKAQIYYFDTFGSDFDTVIRVFPGPCKNGSATGVVCHNDQCGTTQTQWVGAVAAGDNCIVISQRVFASTTSHLMLHVEPGGWNGTALPTGPSKVTTSTTAGLVDDSSATCGGAGGADKAYYITGCPAGSQHLDATTCSANTAYDTVLYVLGPNATELACNDDDAACAAMATASTIPQVQLDGAHLWWVVVDGDGANAGAFTLTTTLQ